METYKSKLLKIIHGEIYKTGYKGGPLAYLDQWENAAIRYNKVAPEGEELPSGFLMNLFALQFKAINDTESIYEQARENTDTFDELANILRKKLAQRDYVQQLDDTSNARINTIHTNMEMTPYSLQQEKYINAAQVYLNLVNQNDGNWKVGWKLWDIMTPEQRKLIIFQRYN